jgi:general secretion pathway protein L
MLNEFLVWWLQQMRYLLRNLVRDLLPQRWRTGIGDNVGALVVEPVADDEAVILRMGAGEQGRFMLTPPGLSAMRALLARLRPKKCILLLSPDRLLERTVSLPLAAERDWPRVMGFEMDRLTPFAANEVFWNGALTRRDRNAGRIEILLSLVPRAPLERLVGSLAEAGIRPHALQAQMPDGQKRVIALQHDASRRAIWERRALVATSAICAVLAITALALPFVQQFVALRDVEQRITALHADTVQAEALRRAIVARLAGSNAMAARRMQSSDPLAVLAAVTDALPDDTYLVDLTLDHGRLSITGQSTAAARLISALAASPRLRNPVFSAPVTRNEAAHSDLFSIRAESVP